EKTLRDVSLYTPPSDGKAFQKRTSFSSLIFSVSPSAQSKSQGTEKSEPSLPSDAAEEEPQQQSVTLPQRPADADKTNPNWPAPTLSPKSQKQEKDDDDNDDTGTPIDLPAFLR
ncbi:MAG: hypothetical protein VKL39_16315, partial [Leptolyngbyaceae bacterium]|nr:hypothetical protein [Leptolyngbyaceae bacterium]